MISVFSVQFFGLDLGVQLLEFGAQDRIIHRPEFRDAADHLLVHRFSRGHLVYVVEVDIQTSCFQLLGQCKSPSSDIVHRDINDTVVI